MAAAGANVTIGKRSAGEESMSELSYQVGGGAVVLLCGGAVVLWCGCVA